MGHQDALRLAIWYLGLLSLTAVLVLLAWRKLYAEFPVFTTYVVVQLVGWTLLLWIEGRFSRTVYWYAWFAQSCLDAGLSMAVVFELYAGMLKPYPWIRRAGIAVCAGASVLMVGLAIWMAMAAPASDVSFAKLTTRVFAWQRSVDFARLALLFVLFVFSRVFGLPWRSYPLGIAVGLAVMTALELLAESIRVEFGFRASPVIVWMAPAGYDLGVLVWSYCLLRQESPLTVRQMPASPSLTRWNAALEELLAR